MRLAPNHKHCIPSLPLPCGFSIRDNPFPLSPFCVENSLFLPQELLPRAHACRDPWAIATLTFLLGQRIEATLGLLSYPHSTTTTSASNNTSSVASHLFQTPSPPNTSVPADGSCGTNPRPEDASILDYVLCLGCATLAGSSVPASLPATLSRMALFSSLSLQAAGLPALAAEALLLADALRPPPPLMLKSNRFPAGSQTMAHGSACSLQLQHLLVQSLCSGLPQGHVAVAAAALAAAAAAAATATDGRSKWPSSCQPLSTFAPPPRTVTPLTCSQLLSRDIPCTDSSSVAEQTSLEAWQLYFASQLAQFTSAGLPLSLSTVQALSFAQSQALQPDSRLVLLPPKHRVSPPTRRPAANTSLPTPTTLVITGNTIPASPVSSKVVSPSVDPSFTVQKSGFSSEMLSRPSFPSPWGVSNYGTASPQSSTTAAASLSRR